jgi:hypothetical protein
MHHEAAKVAMREGMTRMYDAADAVEEERVKDATEVPVAWALVDRDETEAEDGDEEDKEEVVLVDRGDMQLETLVERVVAHAARELMERHWEEDVLAALAAHVVTKLTVVEAERATQAEGTTRRPRWRRRWPSGGRWTAAPPLNAAGSTKRTP